ncbi:hypothetical protein BIU88_05410 [Chlorobaculum limnaeum]|uniref:Uncharacterized protein n=1 Tax=Chlorobaculum limnaeum TaxID=274537 RepID=A0A1D8D290_CHLLM|nr:hypothetical protein [Chlorobaculum limnaeum]AOS83635.1 hypothetical protein BIU88_05410 [Chlorobaculum limnaeum]
MAKRYEVGNDFFREKILAAMLVGFRNVKNPSTVTVHPELMVKIRENFKDKVISPKQFGDVEVFCGLRVIEDVTKEKDYISVN